MMFEPGKIWLDSDGQPIQAHGGGVLLHQGVYYWYGENKDAETTNGRHDVIGVSCYASTDLYTWKNEGVVLPAVPGDLQHDLHPSKVVERPKVLWNAATGKFVLWAHIDSADYKYARAGVAVSDSPTGPFEYLGSVRPNDSMSRDMTLFQDDDGTAYLIYSSEDNATTHITRLSDDYLAPTHEFARAFPGEFREAPAVWKHEGKYFLVSSYCTGWAPNPARWATADAMLGEWKLMGDPCLGSDQERAITFESQSTFVLPLMGQPGQFIFGADRWNSNDLRDSRYVWLPLTVQNGEVQIWWQEQWRWETFPSLP